MTKRANVRPLVLDAIKQCSGDAGKMHDLILAGMGQKPSQPRTCSFVDSKGTCFALVNALARVKIQSDLLDAVKLIANETEFFTHVCANCKNKLQRCDRREVYMVCQLEHIQAKLGV